ncbi:MAG: hypothetical protein PVG25_09795, partial [Anaerolineae bacterium]|jgi:ATP-dependent Clp protease ATP-binding subunit ClpC
MSELGLEVQLTDESRNWLAREGFDPQFGARPLRRALQRHVENPLSIRLLRGDFKKGNVVVVDVDEDGLVFQPRTEWRELGERATETISENVTVES